ncbi:MAG: lamin tail domain-containing protein [Myxococcales bacterium]|nr:lamin tail domain-containing protein [Myxococcales bacterium]
MRPVLVGMLAACAPGSGFDDRPPVLDVDTDADTDADADTDTDADVDTAPTAATALTGDTAGTGQTAVTGDTGVQTGDTALPPVVLAVVNEVLLDAPVGLAGDANCDGVRDSGDSFVEIVNTSGASLDLGGYELSDGASAVHHTVAAATVLEPGGMLVVFAGGTPTFDGSGIAGTWCQDWPASTVFQLSSSGALPFDVKGDSAVLHAGDGTLVDTFTWTVPVAGQSLNRSPEQQPLSAVVEHESVPGAVHAWSPGMLAGGVPEPYRAEITVDGSVADYAADAEFETSSLDLTWVAWSATHLYVAVNHGTISDQSADAWVVITLGTGVAAHTTTGIAIGGQEPTLAFDASHALRWRTDDGASGLFTYDGKAWVEDVGWLGAKSNGSSVAVDVTSGIVEIGIPWAEVDAYATADLVIAIVDDTAKAATTVSATPQTAITDGTFDPDYATYWPFRPQLASVPNATAALP